MWDSFIWSTVKNRVGNSRLTLVALALLVFIPVSFAHAADEEEEGSGDESAPTGHWYVGGSTGYLKPDSDRLSGNTRSLGFQGGYQFNDRWSVEHQHQEDAFGPGNDSLKLDSLNFSRYWGNEFRFLVDFGYTHISLDGDAEDGSTAGFHVGAGLSAFITDHLELRGDARFINTMNGGLKDGMGLLSLNYHFVKPRSVRDEGEESVLGESSDSNESLPPMAYREPAEVEEPVETETVAPIPDVVPAPSPSEMASATPESVPVESALAPELPVASSPAPVSQDSGNADFVAPGAVPKSTHTMLNFGSNGVEITAQDSAQLDQLSQEIKNTNSKAIIEGHTDGQGSSESNKVLSLDRAIVVKRELKNRGVSGDKLRAVGMGEEHPVASNDTKEGRAQNRRVDVKIY